MLPLAVMGPEIDGNGSTIMTLAHVETWGSMEGYGKSMTKVEG